MKRVRRRWLYSNVQRRQLPRPTCDLLISCVNISFGSNQGSNDGRIPRDMQRGVALGVSVERNERRRCCVSDVQGRQMLQRTCSPLHSRPLWQRAKIGPTPSVRLTTQDCCLAQSLQSWSPTAGPHLHRYAMLATKTNLCIYIDSSCPTQMLRSVEACPSRQKGRCRQKDRCKPQKQE
jgi:hypothetical protein